MREDTFELTQYCVFVDREDGPHGIAADYNADHALVKAALYYYDMNKHDHNDMDMSEIDRFYIRTRHVTFSAMSEDVILAKDAVEEYNAWYGEHWTA